MARWYRFRSNIFYFLYLSSPLSWLKETVALHYVVVIAWCGNVSCFRCRRDVTAVVWRTRASYSLVLWIDVLSLTTVVVSWASMCRCLDSPIKVSVRCSSRRVSIFMKRAYCQVDALDRYKTFGVVLLGPFACWVGDIENLRLAMHSCLRKNTSRRNQHVLG